MTLLVQRSDVGEFRRRYRWMVLVVIATFILLTAKLIQLQVFDGDLHKSEARANIVHKERLPTTRGVIRDAYGRVLAANRPSYNVYIVPEYAIMSRLFSSLAEKVLKMNDEQEGRLRKQIIEAIEKPDGKKERLLFKAGVEDNVASILEQRAGDLKLEVVRGKDDQNDVYGTPERVVIFDEIWPTIVRLMRLNDREQVELSKRVFRAAKELKRSRHQILLKADVDRDVVALLETQGEELKGIVQVAPVPVRYYPYGELGAHLVGYMREIDEETLSRLRTQGYREGDLLGAIGVERRWESYLRGQRGERKLLKRRHREISEEMEAKYLEEPRRVEPVPGRDVSLTVDVDLVKAMRQAMAGHAAGAIVVVDVRTGRLLGALSWPSFDPNVASGGSGQDAVRDAFRRLYANPLKPTLDKTISAAYPPGSTYKPFSALAGLAERLLDPYAQVDCRGGYEYGRRRFRCTGVHEKVNLHDAIVRSCNTYFYVLGEQIHIDRLAKIGLDFGLGQKTGIGVNPEAPGRMPTKSWYTRRYKQFVGGFSLNAAIGQGASTVTVLQLALAYAALANGGTLYQPQVVRNIETSDGTIVQEFPPRVRRVIELDQDHLGMVKRALSDVVADTQGTAHRKRVEGVDIAGKTGTAEVSRQSSRTIDPKKTWYFSRDHAWFVGYAPAASPEIAIVVLIEHGGGGGEYAVPVAMRVVQQWQMLKEKRLSARAANKTAQNNRGGL